MRCIEMMKPARLLRLALIPLMVFTLSAYGCAPQTQKGSDAAQAQDKAEETPAVSAPVIRQTSIPSFATKSGKLVSNTGTDLTLTFPSDLKVSGSKVIGPCRENLVFVQYTTATYNEQWKSYDDEVTHYGFLDGSGKFMFSIDPIVEKYGSTNNGSNSIRVDTGAYFNEGVAIVGIQNGNGSTHVAIDSSGSEIFSTTSQIEKEFKGGVIKVTADKSYTIYDKDGKVLLQTPDSIQCVGLGYYFIGDGSTGVLDYKGNVVLDIANIAAEGADNIKISAPGNEGIIKVEQKRGSANLYGLYSIPLQEWIIKPDSEDFKVQYGDELTLFINYGKDGYRFLNTDGTWVADLDTIPASSTGKPYSSTECLDLGNGWFLIHISYYSHGSSAGTWGLIHADGTTYSLEDCDPVIDYKEDGLYL